MPRGLYRSWCETRFGRMSSSAPLVVALWAAITFPKKRTGLRNRRSICAMIRNFSALLIFSRKRKRCSTMNILSTKLVMETCPSPLMFSLRIPANSLWLQQIALRGKRIFLIKTCRVFCRPPWPQPGLFPSPALPWCF